MAARKSCTKFTWAEAKAKVGGSSSSNGAKSKPVPKKLPHKDLHAQKIVAKHSHSDGGLTRAQVRRHERADARAVAAIAAAKEERLREQDQRAMIRPVEWAQERMETLATELQTHPINEPPSSSCSISGWTPEEKRNVAECKQLQVDEILALEAIYTDTNIFHVHSSSQVEKLQSLVEEYGSDESNTNILELLNQHPPITITLSLAIDDHRQIDGDDSRELVAFVVLVITLPEMYPLYDATPNINIKDIMVVDRRADAIRSDKQLESLVHPKERELMQHLQEACVEILPDPCIYEVTGSWLNEHVFDFVELRTHAKME